MIKITQDKPGLLILLCLDNKFYPAGRGSNREMASKVKEKIKKKSTTKVVNQGNLGKHFHLPLIWLYGFELLNDNHSQQA